MVGTKQANVKVRTMATQTDPSKTAVAKKPEAPAINGARGRKSKEDTVYSISFLNDKNEETTRIPANVTGVKVTDCNGKSKVINIKDINSVVLIQLAADMARKKLNSFLNEVTKNDVGRIQTLTDEFVKVAKDATLYIPKEGGGPGRSFDYDYWIAVVEHVADTLVKAGNPKARKMTEKDKEAFRAKMSAMTPDQRNEWKKKSEQNKVFKNSALKIRSDRENAKLTKSEMVSDDDILASF